MSEEKNSKLEEFEKSDYIELEVSEDIVNAHKEEKQKLKAASDKQKDQIEEQSEDNNQLSHAGDEKKSEKSSDDKKSEKSSDEKKSEKLSDEKKEENSKNGSNESNKDSKAISQSKRLADVKAANDGKTTDTGSDTIKVQESTEKPKKKKWPIVILCITLVVFLAAYFTGFWYFSSNFYPDVAINGTNVSNMDEVTAKQTLDNFYKAYVLTIHTIDNEDVKINGKDIDMVITLKEDISKCLQDQKPYLWFVEIFNHQDFQIDADATWNQEKLEAIYKEMAILNSKDIVDPVDAYIGLDGNHFAIIDEVMGNRLEEDIFKQKVAEKLQLIQAKMDLQEEDCYCKPSVYKDSQELVDEYTKLGDYKNCVITLKLDDLEIEPGIEFLDAVLDIQGNTKTVSETKVDNYVKKLAEQYDTYGTKRNFKTSWGNQYVQIEGKYIGYVMDQEKTASDLYQALEAKKPATVEATFTQKGITLVGENDIGDTYIEANLSKQKVVAYKDGKKIAESDCVSGCISQGHGTCLGMYKIQAKQSPATLRGEKVPKTRTVIAFDEAGNPYETQETTMEYSYESYVTYWMPFNGGYGLHDADGWRRSYGGDIFVYSGSHGCINLPGAFAKKLYETFDVGTPVLVYYEDNDDRISKD